MHGSGNGRVGEWMMPRREVLKRLAGGIAAGALAPAAAAGARAAEVIGGPGAAPRLQGAADEAYWKLVKGRFPIRPGLIMMNAANLCPTHYAVLERVFGLTRDMDADVSFQNRGKFGGLKTRSRELLAEYVGADPDEIAITRNTSEGNNTIVGGLELGEGDEVLLWDQNHPTNNLAWEVRARRYGFTVKKVSTDEKPNEPDDLLRPFVQALTSRTRVFAASHVSNTSGFGLPMKELCRICRERGIVTLVDGAQTFGALALDLHDLGCDFFTGSVHKWPMGPKEAGLLYVRRGMAERVWPSVVAVGYGGAEGRGAEKFENLGQRDDPTVAAVATTIEFHNTIGKERVEARLREITDALKSEIAKIPGAYVHTPDAHAMSAGVVIFSLPGVSGRDGFNTLYDKYDVGSASAGAIDGIRLSPHIYNTMADVERVMNALREMAA